MRSVRYFLTLLLGAGALALGVGLVYTRYAGRPMALAIQLPTAARDSSADGVQPTGGVDADAPNAAQAQVQSDAGVQRSSRMDTSASGSAIVPPTSSADSSPTSRTPTQGGAGVDSRNTTPRSDTLRAGSDSAISLRADSGKADTLKGAPAASAPAATTWQPSPRQLARDSAFVLNNAGQVAAAIRVLDAWARENEGDTAVLRDLARLSSSVGDHAAATGYYRRLLLLDQSAATLHEATTAHYAAGDSTGAIALLARAVDAAPSDTAMRHQFAHALSWNGDQRGAIAQYDVLIATHRSAHFLFDRGQLHSWNGNAGAAEADLLAALALEPRSETRLMLADQYRWQGALTSAREQYRLVLETSPTDARALEGMRLLNDQLDSRLRSGSGLAAGAAGTRARATSDNAGFEDLSLTMGQAFAFPGTGSTQLSLQGELRSASREVAGLAVGNLRGLGADAAVAHLAGTTRFEFSLGVLDLEAHRRLLRGSFSADALLTFGRMALRAERLPAYELLWSPRLLGGTGQPGELVLLEADRVSLALSEAQLPWGELWLSGGFVNVHDGNSRGSLEYALRTRSNIRTGLSLVYSGGWLGYSDQTTDYFSPGAYLSQSFGVEYSRWRSEGVSVRARLMPGYAWMREYLESPGAMPHSDGALQLSASGELTWRRNGWELGIGGALGSGRGSGYLSHQLSLSLQRVW